VPCAVICAVSECYSLSRHSVSHSRTTSALYVSFSVGAVAVTALYLSTVPRVSTVPQVSALSVVSRTSDRHRRSLLNDTMLDRNDTVLNGTDTVLDMSDTVLNETAGNDTKLPNVTPSVLPVTSTVAASRAVARKPKFLDASRLNQQHKAADGSLYRHKIRGKLGRVPADDDEGHKVPPPSVVLGHSTTTPANNTTTGVTDTGDNECHL